MIQRLIESRSGNSSYWEQGREIQDRTRCHLHNPEHRQPCLGNSQPPIGPVVKQACAHGFCEEKLGRLKIVCGSVS